MSNPHIEVGTWWHNLHTGEVRQVADVTPHGVRLLCSECGGDEPFRWSQFVPSWELAPGPKEEPDVEKLLKLEQAIRKRLDYLENPPPDLRGPRFTSRDQLRDELQAILKEAGLE